MRNIINDKQMQKLFNELCEFNKDYLRNTDYKDRYCGTKIDYIVNEEYTIHCSFDTCTVWKDNTPTDDCEWEISITVRLANDWSYKSLIEAPFKTKDFSEEGIKNIKAHIEKLINACKEMPVMFDLLKTQFNTILAR